MPLLLVMLVVPAMLPVNLGAGQPDQAELARIATLHRWVYKLQGLLVVAGHAAARELGLPYIEGRGLARSHSGVRADSTRDLGQRGEDPAARADAERPKLYCRGLSTNQNHEAWELAYCGIFGVTPPVIVLAPVSQIDISRRGLVLDTPAGRTTAKLSWGPVGCGHQVALVRYARVDPPVALALPARLPSRSCGMGVGAGHHRDRPWAPVVPVRHHVEDRAGRDRGP